MDRKSFGKQCISCQHYSKTNNDNNIFLLQHIITGKTKHLWRSSVHSINVRSVINAVKFMSSYIISPQQIIYSIQSLFTQGSHYRLHYLLILGPFYIIYFPFSRVHAVILNHQKMCEKLILYHWTQVKATTSPDIWSRACNLVQAVESSCTAPCVMPHTPQPTRPPKLVVSCSWQVSSILVSPD